jgi:predicted site-specific integrase-resolvase
MAPTALEERLWTPAELAARYGLSLVTLRNWRYLGRGPRSITIGGKPLYPQSEVARFEAGRRRAGGRMPRTEPGPDG